MSIYTSKHSQEKKFYTYQYIREVSSVNGEAGTPYYIGKGQGQRKFKSHGKSIPVPKDINRIIMVSEPVNEADAFQVEVLLIAKFGRLDKGTGILRNKTNGGDGTTGRIRTEAEIRASVIKSNETKKRNGTLNSNTPTSIAKCRATKEKNGSYKPTAETIAKTLETKKRNGTLMNGFEAAWKTPRSEESRKLGAAKAMETRKRNGKIINTPETIAKCKETKKKNGTTNNNRAQMLETKRKNGTMNSNTPQNRAKAFITRKLNQQKKLLAQRLNEPISTNNFNT